MTKFEAYDTANRKRLSKNRTDGSIGMLTFTAETVDDALVITMHRKAIRGPDSNQLSYASLTIELRGKERRDFHKFMRLYEPLFIAEPKEDAHVKGCECSRCWQEMEGHGGARG